MITQHERINNNLNNMMSYCLKFKTDAGNKNPNVLKTSQWKTNSYIKLCSVEN